MLKNNFRAIIGLSLLFAGAIIFGLICGSVRIPWCELFLEKNRPILYVRLLRIILACAAGSGLSICGIVLQAVLRNPLADPYLLGTSSGASLGAVMALALGLNALYMPLVAFCGAIFAVLIVYAVANERGRLYAHSLILAGVIVSIALSGIVVFTVSISPNEALYGLMWWLWGSLEVYNVQALFMVCVLVATAVVVIFVFHQDLNAISLGEERARHLGINTELSKKILLILASLVTASLVCVCGIIGFVGLIVPHTVRLLCGANHRRLIPLSCLLGSVFMIICDTLGRVIFAPVQLPIGVTTAVLGAPVFIFLFRKRQRSA
jgi:iron complex transport system permease protein